MEQHGGRRVVAMDLATGSLVVRELVQPVAGRVGVRACLGDPEEDLRERILQRVGEHDADLLGGSDAVPNLVLEGANPSNTLVASPAEPTVDEILDLCAQGTERQRHDERRQRDDPRGFAADDDAEPDRDRRVDGKE